MRNYFVFDDLNSTTYGVYISGHGVFSAPKRAQTMNVIPGRNGDLIGTEKRFENLELTYPAFIYANFKQNIQDFRNAMLSKFGYFELADTYNPNEYRMATFMSEIAPEVTERNDAGSFDIVFNCKPQRFLTSGKTAVTYSTPNTVHTLNNPTKFDAQPLIKVVGTGELAINTQTITITAADAYTMIDCAMMDCYYGTASKNEYVEFSDYNFPVLVPGNNSISFNGLITSVEITPKWWQL